MVPCEVSLNVALRLVGAEMIVPVVYRLIGGVWPISLSGDLIWDI